MVSGDIIYGKELEVPFRTDIWFCCIEWTGTGFVNIACRDTQQGRRNLLEFLTNLKYDKSKGEVLAVWPGRYVTQLFKIMPDLFIPRLKMRMKEKGDHP